MAQLKGLGHLPHQGIRDHPQGLHEMLAESLDVFPVLHFILIIEGEEGLAVGVSRVPELKGQPTPARELLLHPHKRQLCKIGPLGGRLRHVILWRYGSPGPIWGINHLDVRLSLPLVRRRVVDGEIDHSWSRLLGWDWPPISWCLRLHIGRWHGHLPFRLAHQLPRLIQLTSLRSRLWL
jgi:hypothetical protein